MAGGRDLGEAVPELAVLVEQLAWPVAQHPVLQLRQVFRLVEIGERDLMGAPGAFDGQPIDELRSGPALGRLQDDHGPARPFGRHVRGALARLGLNGLNLGQHQVERRGEVLVHDRGLVAIYEVRVVAIAAQQVGQFLTADPRQDGGVGDLEAVEMQDGQHRAVGTRIKELVRMPARGEGSGFSLAVADHAGHDQIGIVEGGAIGVNQRIA